MTYRPVYFKLYELVDPLILQERGERAWELLHPGMLQALDGLREKFGPLLINDGRTFKESGLRRWDTTTGAKYSMHKFGCALDLKPHACQPKDIYDYLLAHPDEFPAIKAVENIAATPTWVHVDGRNGDWPGIQVVNP